MALQTSAEIDNATRGARQRPSAASGGPGGLLRGEDGVTDEFCSRKRDRLEGADPLSQHSKSASETRGGHHRHSRGVHIR